MVIFGTSKSRCMFQLRKKPARLTWTQAWRRLNKKGKVRDVCRLRGGNRFDGRFPDRGGWSPTHTEDTQVAARYCWLGSRGCTCVVRVAGWRAHIMGDSSSASALRSQRSARRPVTRLCGTLCVLCFFVLCSSRCSLSLQRDQVSQGRVSRQDREEGSR